MSTRILLNLAASLASIVERSDFGQNDDQHVWSTNAGQRSTLYQGCSACEWADFARKKSKIASSVCRERGIIQSEVCAIKQKLADIPQANHAATALPSVVPSITSRSIVAVLDEATDPFILSDPWKQKVANASHSLRYRFQTTEY